MKTSSKLDREKTEDECEHSLETFIYPSRTQAEANYSILLAIDVALYIMFMCVYVYDDALLNPLCLSHSSRIPSFFTHNRRN
mmetsp:Transcript_3710/g.7836  ORF Transcript_3710/g.7836 Transcript_3710/m.7836 type:complete len:82 (-) Transcript_3710:33-278(-)